MKQTKGCDLNNPNINPLTVKNPTPLNLRTETLLWLKSTLLCHLYVDRWRASAAEHPSNRQQCEVLRVVRIPDVQKKSQARSTVTPIDVNTRSTVHPLWALSGGKFLKEQTLTLGKDIVSDEMFDYSHCVAVNRRSRSLWKKQLIPTDPINGNPLPHNT